MLTTFLPGWPYQGLGLFSGCAGDAQPWPGWSLHSPSHLLSRLSFFVDRSYMLWLRCVRQGCSNCVVRPKSSHSYICQVLSQGCTSTPRRLARHTSSRCIFNCALCDRIGGRFQGWPHPLAQSHPHLSDGWHDHPFGSQPCPPPHTGACTQRSRV